MRLTDQGIIASDPCFDRVCCAKVNAVMHTTEVNEDLALLLLTCYYGDSDECWCQAAKHLFGMTCPLKMCIQPATWAATPARSMIPHQHVKVFLLLNLCRACLLSLSCHPFFAAERHLHSHKQQSCHTGCENFIVSTAAGILLSSCLVLTGQED